MTPQQLEGITKARLSACIADNKVTYPTDQDYINKVCEDANLTELPESAADSYASQWSNKTIQELEEQLNTILLAAENTETPQEPIEPPLVEINNVPTKITMRQARLALHNAGLLESVNTAIASLEEPMKTQAEIEWEYTAIVYRSSGLIPQIGAAIGMTETEIDDLFIAAAKL